MTNYWLCLITLGNWDIAKKKGMYGVWKRWNTRIRKVRKGDIMIFYVVPGKKQIVGMARVASEAFDDFKNQIWPGFYPHRIRIEVLNDISETPLSIYDIIGEMLLFQGKPLGPTLFGKSIIPLSEHDYKITLAAIRRCVVKRS